MPTVTIQEAQAKLDELIHFLVITENDQPVAKLVSTELLRGSPRVPQLGTQRGSVLFMAPDFDTPLDKFKEYME